MLTSPFRTFSVVLLASSGLAALAPATDFGFENLDASYRGAGSRPGAYTRVSQTVGDLTLTATRQQGASFDVYGNLDAPQPGDAYGQNRWLDGFNIRDERAFVFDFSAPLSSFSTFMGQFNASQFRNAVLRAFSGVGGTGTMLAESTGTIPIISNAFGGFTGVVLTVNGSAIRSVTATMNGAFNNGFIDNGQATAAPVPEPAPVAALGLGAAAMLRRWRRS